MITNESVFKIGRLQKTHGIKGEIIIIYDQPHYCDIDVDFYFLDLDSIYVPFEIEEINFMSDVRGRIKFEDIDSENKASEFSNKDIYILRDEMPETENDDIADWDWFIGYKVKDQNNNILGTIEYVDYSTINTLFIVKDGDTEHLIPATEDFITEVDEENMTIHMVLPDRLIEQ